MGFSIHALLAESDSLTSNAYAWTLIFLSTLSLRRATWCGRLFTRKKNFSIHALLAESDAKQEDITQVFDALFYPRSPCGERLAGASDSVTIKQLFYPRSPCGERRHVLTLGFFIACFSIHALLAESDQWPAGWLASLPQCFSIHALLAESDTGGALAIKCT